jgi:argininosuccinate synthase
MHLHEGLYLDPAMRDMEAFLQSSQEKVSGDVHATLKPYSFTLDGISSENDLMNTAFGQYGEMNNGWSADEVKGFIKVHSNQTKIYHQLHGVQ